MTLPLLSGRADLAPKFLAVVADPVTRETVRDVAGQLGWDAASVRDGGVFWPISPPEHVTWAAASDHHLVWLDLAAVPLDPKE